MKVHTVLMAGGVGSRLYPLSTPEKPKQFLDVLGTGQTLLQITYSRFKQSIPNATFWSVCPSRYFKYFGEQDVDCFIIPEVIEGKNTAPAIARAVKLFSSVCDDNDVMVISPTDAYIREVDEFSKDISKAIDLAACHNKIVCLGITPTFPSTEYGYIEYSGNDIVRFREKPSVEVASDYISTGNFLWNAGIFVTKVGVLRSLYDQYVPDIMSQLDKEDCPKISIDYAILEKAGGMVIPVSWTWSDLGSFEAIEKVKWQIVNNQQF